MRQKERAWEEWKEGERDRETEKGKKTEEYCYYTLLRVVNFYCHFYYCFVIYYYYYYSSFVIWYVINSGVQPIFFILLFLLRDKKDEYQLCHYILVSYKKFIVIFVVLFYVISNYLDMRWIENIQSELAWSTFKTVEGEIANQN